MTYMSPIELAKKYLEIFYSANNLERLYSICDENLVFSGPFIQSNTASEYVESLVEDPPVGMSYQIVSAYENTNSACVIYEFSKGDINVLMAQEFYTAAGKITQITQRKISKKCKYSIPVVCKAIKR